MIRRVFLDLDGVMADFMGSVLRLNNKEARNVLPRMKGAYDINTLFDMSPREFWGKVTDDPLFWHNLQKTEEADALLALVSKPPRTPEQIFFCSSPTLDPQSHGGKAAWVQQHYNGYFRRLILCSQKHLLANRESVLIDDSDSNVDAFRVAGGRGILFPRPWNSKHSFSGDPLKLVQMELNRL